MTDRTAVGNPTLAASLDASIDFPAKNLSNANAADGVEERQVATSNVGRDHLCEPNKRDRMCGSNDRRRHDHVARRDPQWRRGFAALERHRDRGVAV